MADTSFFIIIIINIVICDFKLSSKFTSYTNSENILIKYYFLFKLIQYLYNINLFIVWGSLSVRFDNIMINLTKWMNYILQGHICGNIIEYDSS